MKEIGYTDTIIDVRSARVRSLLGLQPQHENEGEGAQPALVNGESSNKRAIDQGKARSVKFFMLGDLTGKISITAEQQYAVKSTSW